MVTQKLKVPPFFLFADLRVTLPSEPVVPEEVPLTAPDHCPVTVALLTLAPLSFLIQTVALA